VEWRLEDAGKEMNHRSKILTSAVLENSWRAVFSALIISVLMVSVGSCRKKPQDLNQPVGREIENSTPNPKFPKYYGETDFVPRDLWLKVPRIDEKPIGDEGLCKQISECIARNQEYLHGGAVGMQRWCTCKVFDPTDTDGKRLAWEIGIYPGGGLVAITKVEHIKQGVNLYTDLGAYLDKELAVACRDAISKKYSD